MSVATRSLCHWHAGNGSDWADRSYREQHEISAIDNRLHVNGKPIGSASLQIRPADKLFEVRDRQYRGGLDISISTEGRLVLMEQLPLEDYIRSVVPSEMPARWPMNALRAQAVAARTFAAHRMQNKNGRRWMSRLDLAYKGVDGEYP
ncbi:MAG: SpoIID/LytB domain-containing protein, partial [Planctomycetota bacterium]